MSKLLVLLLLLGGMIPAVAAEEIKLQVVGEIGIDPEGKVFATDIKTVVMPKVKELIDTTVSRWQFEPVLVDGKPAHVKSGMNLTLAAEKVGEGYQLRIERARFYSARSMLRTIPPRYPTEAARAGVGADVLVAVRVDAAGKVVDAAVVETSLPYRNAGAKTGEKWAKYFEKATLAAVKDWEYAPARIEFGEVDDATLIVPVSYRMGEASFNGWQVESGQTRKQIPWLAENAQQFDAAGLRQGESLALNQSVKLKTQVEGTPL